MSKPSTHCERHRAMLTELVYGELEADAARDLERHLESCASCSEELEQLRRLRALMERAQPIEIPAGLESRVMSEARSALERGSAATRPAAPERSRPWWSGWLVSRPVLRPALAAALTLLFVAGVVLLLEGREGGVLQRYADEPGEGPPAELPAPPPPARHREQSREQPPAPAAVPEQPAAGDVGTEAPPPAAPYGSTADRDGPAATKRKVPAEGGAKTGEGAAPPGALDDESTAAKDDVSGLLGAGSAGGGKAPTQPSAQEPVTGATPESYSFSAPAPAADGPPAAAKAPPAPKPGSPAKAAPAPAAEDMEEGAAGGGPPAKKPAWLSKSKKKAEQQAPAAEAEEKPAVDPFERAVELAKTGENDEAIALLQKIKADPTMSGASPAKVYHQLAVCLAAAGDEGKALIYFENLFARWPKYPARHQAMWQAANLYIRTGDATSARKLLEKLLSSAAYGEKAREKLEELE
jgi:anti-sigma factor RsiW